MMATEWPSLLSRAANSLPTRPQPSTTTCMASIMPGNIQTGGRWGSRYPARSFRYRALVALRAPVPNTDTADDAPPERPAPPLSLRLKNTFLGRPLRTADLAHERLGKPTALAVFASDNLSSSAYATEEILHVLVPAIGLAAFSLVVPVTVALLVVLAFLILSYRQTIKAYPSSGGAYVVTKDNFGIVPAQVAGAALLIDYVLTVAVSVAAGTAAITSAAGALRPCSIEI